MREQLQPFLDYLRLNRNLSRHTVRAYGSDLSQFFEFAAALLGREPRVEDFDHRLVRDYLAETYERRQASSSSARKLAAVRTFARYLRREGLLAWWPQGDGPAPVNQGRWRALVKYGEKYDAGHAFEICAIAARQPTEELWRRWVERATTGLSDAPVSLPAAEFVVAEYLLRVRKNGLHSWLK